MKASEANKLATVAVALKTMGPLLQKIRLAAEGGLFRLYLSRRELGGEDLPDAQILALRSLGYGVEDQYEDGEQGGTSRFVGRLITWGKE